MELTSVFPSRGTLLREVFPAYGIVANFLDALISINKGKSVDSQTIVMNSSYLQNVFRARNDQEFKQVNNSKITPNENLQLKTKPIYDANVLETAVFLETTLTIGQLQNESKVEFSDVLRQSLSLLESMEFNDSDHIDSNSKYKEYLIDLYASKLLFEACNTQTDDIDNSKLLFQFPFSNKVAKDIAFRKAVFSKMIELMKANNIAPSSQLVLAVQLHSKSSSRHFNTTK